jgi:Spy/CpxP family protein refolding chaperone
MTPLSKWKIAVYLAAIFLAGAISGWMAATTLARYEATKTPPPHQNALSFKERIRTLRLNPDQQVQVNAIVDRSAAEISAVTEENVHRLKHCFSNRHAQVSAVLTAEQRQQFEQCERAWRMRKADKSRQTNSP